MKWASSVGQHAGNDQDDADADALSPWSSSLIVVRDLEKCLPLLPTTSKPTLAANLSSHSWRLGCSQIGAPKQKHAQCLDNNYALKLDCCLNNLMSQPRVWIPKTKTATATTTTTSKQLLRLLLLHWLPLVPITSCLCSVAWKASTWLGVSHLIPLSSHKLFTCAQPSLRVKCSDNLSILSSWFVVMKFIRTLDSLT